MAKVNLAQIWDNLNALRCKQQFVNEADMIMNDQLLNGDIALHKDTVFGKAKIKMELEIEFEKNLNQLEELLKGARDE